MRQYVVYFPERMSTNRRRHAGGSVLGLLLFVLFISPVLDVIGLIPDIRNESGIVSFHQYADDSQLYIYVQILQYLQLK